LHIQIKHYQNSIDFPYETILTLQALWLQVNPNQVDGLFLTFGDEIVPQADLHIDVIDSKQIKVGFLPVEDENTEFTNLNQRNLHWVTISEWSSDKSGMLTNFLIFLIGIINSPSQMGTYMTDFLDFKIAMQFGTESSYMSLEDANAFFQANLKQTLSSIMLLNTESPMSKKMSQVGGLIQQGGDENQHLCILNITDNIYLPRTNMGIFIINTQAKIIH
jgi:hypothetical protein